MSSKPHFSTAPLEARKTVNLHFEKSETIPHPQFDGMTLSFGNAELTLVAYFDSRERSWKARSFSVVAFEMDLGGARFYSFGKPNGSPWELAELLSPELKKRLKHELLTPFLDGLNGVQETGERDSPIAIDSSDRRGLGSEDLEAALTKLLYRYGPGNEPQRRALQLALDSLAGRD